MCASPSLNRRRGKAYQKALAKRLGGLDIGVLGGADVILDHFAIEAKSVARFTGATWMQQAIKNAARLGKTPLVSVHVRGSKHDNDIVLIRLGDFLKLIGGKNGETHHNSNMS